MKKVDFRSLIIGLLGGVCIFLMMGQNRGNMGDIVVNSIEVRDDGNGGFITTYNSDGESTVYLGTSGNNNGMLLINNSYGNKVAFLGTGLEGKGGKLSTYNKNGTESIYVGTSIEGFGIIRTFNEYAIESTYLGTNTNNNGMISISDRYGNETWVK